MVAHRSRSGDTDVSSCKEWRLQQEQNTLGQPLGFKVEGWAAPERPGRKALSGRTCIVEPLDAARHAAPLYEANSLDKEGRSWTYLAYGPFPAFDDYEKWFVQAQTSSDPLFFAIIDRAVNLAVGIASYLRIDPASGSIEIGHLHFSPLLQRTPAATEAIFLMIDRAFQLGYRRVEWKCNSLNMTSRRSAQRLGFSFEGTFRQATVVKGRNRDTAWYAIIDGEWPALRRAFVRWLDPANFAPDGSQILALSALTDPLLAQRG
jgi:RimJ/RimL family protein N-acetyltransferase